MRGASWTGSSWSVDNTTALDTTTLAILGIGPQRLQELGVDVYELVNKAEQIFSVTVSYNGQQVRGFDFTQATHRGPAIWIEGSRQFLSSYAVLEAWFSQQGNTVRAYEFYQKMVVLSSELAKLRTVTQASIFEPYTVPGSIVPFVDSGYSTPPDTADAAISEALSFFNASGVNTLTGKIIPIKKFDMIYFPLVVANAGLADKPNPYPLPVSPKAQRQAKQEFGKSWTSEAFTFQDLQGIRVVID